MEDAGGDSRSLYTGGCRKPQTVLSPYLGERPVVSAGFPYYRTGRREFHRDRTASDDHADR